MLAAKFIPRELPPSVQNLELAKTQAQAVVSRGVTVLYGSPGSGKSTTLIAKFLKLVESGLHPEQILVITQTRDSANRLRDHLALELAGVSQGPLAKTLTSFAFSIVTERAKKNALAGPTLLSGSEQDALIARLISELGQEIWPAEIDKLTISLQGFRTELRDLLQVCLEWGIGPSKLIELSKIHVRKSWSAAAKVLEAYLAELEETNKLDAAMLLRRAAAEISKPNELGSSIRAILVDDAQELTPSASELIFALAANSDDLTLFGDPDVATLGFRSANPKAMSNLAEKIAEQKKVTVTSIFLEPVHAVRRPEISSALGKVLSQIEVARAGRQRRGINPPSDLVKGDSLVAKVFGSESDEITFLASELRKKHLFAGVPWSKMAVIARSRPTLESLALRLSAESVPVRIQGGLTTLRDEHAAGQLLRLARFVLDPRELALEEITSLLVSDATGVDAIGFQRLKRSLRNELEDAALSDEKILQQLLADPKMLIGISIQPAKKLTKLFDLIDSLRKENQVEPLSIETLLWRLYSETGLKKRWIADARGLSEIALQANRNLDSVLTLFASANRFTERSPNSDALEFIQDQLSRELPEDSLALNDFQGDYVSLLTPSALIGKRFDLVALPGLTEGIWPNLRPRSSLLGAKTLDLLLQGEIQAVDEVPRSELGDELRMLAKAMGSTTEYLILSATEREDEQISQFFSLVNGQIPETERVIERNPTLRSLTGLLRREIVAGPKEKVAEVALGLARLALARTPGADPSSWYGTRALSTSEELVDLSSEKVTVRPSQLENYLKCPLHWFIETHGGGQSTFQASLGTLIHEVLELSSDSSEESLEKLVSARWHTLEFEADWLADAAKRQAGKLVGNLANYLRKFDELGGTVVAREENFSFELETVRVRGQVDRIEKLPDGNCVIVDLKTGKSQLTQAELQEHAQLSLYQLAFIEGGFNHISELSNATLGGAKLLVIGGDGASEKKQDALTLEKSASFRKLLLQVSEGMAKPVFVAKLSSHCSSEREHGSCQLHLTKAVSFVG